MVDRVMSARRILDFAVMKMSPDKTPSKKRPGGHRKPSASPARMKREVPVSTIIEFFSNSAKLENKIVSTERASQSNHEEPTDQFYSTAFTSPTRLYQLAEPEGFEEIIRKAAIVVAKKENIKAQFDSSYLSDSVTKSAIAASEGGFNWMDILGFSATSSVLNGAYVYFCGERLDKMMERGFSHEIDALLMKCLRQAAYQYRWSDLRGLASGDTLSNGEVFAAIRNALDSFIQEVPLNPLGSPEIEFIKAAI